MATFILTLTQGTSIEVAVPVPAQLTSSPASLIGTFIVTGTPPIGMHLEYRAKFPWLVGTPTRLGDSGLSFAVIYNVTPPRYVTFDLQTTVLAPGSGGTDGTSPRLTLPQAEAEAWNGVKVRRAAWASKYWEIVNAIWWVQNLSATTKALTTRRILEDSDYDDADLHATDYTFAGIAGQSPDAGKYWQAITAKIA